MAFDQARFDSLLAQAAEYQGAKNAAAAAAGASRSDPAAFMNVGNQLANAVNAYQAGNIADVNKALTQSGLQGSQVMTGLNLGAADMLNLEQQGVKFAGAPTLGNIPTIIDTGMSGITTLANTGAAGGPGTLTAGTPTYGDLITQAYGSIGRTGFGTGTANIDQPGYDYWMSELTSGRLTPDNFRSTFDRAVDQFIAANPDNAYTRQALETKLPSIFTTGTDMTGLAGTGTVGQKVDFNTLNKGFEWAQANKFDEAALKRILGEKTYNQFADLYGRGILWSLQPALADNKISGIEALDVVTSAKRLGLDNPDEIAKFTKLNPELVKAFFDTSDKALTGIIGDALNPNNTMTTRDRLASILALQNRGIEDVDIAKYSNGKVTKEQVSSFLNPLRSFSGDFEKTFVSPDATFDRANSFIEKSLNDPAIKALYGDKLNEFDQKLDVMKQKWDRYGVDALQADTLYNQINGITNAAGGKNWSGDWMSGGDNAAMEAAAMLQKKGVDSLKDLKVTPKFESTEAVEMFNGQPVQTDKDGRKFTTAYNDYTGAAEQTYLPAGAQTQLAYPKVSGYAGESGGEYVEYVPLTADELKTYDSKTGKFDLLTGKNLIDSSTGKVISSMPGATNNFVIDTYDTGNLFKGKDKTFGIMMNDAGVPIPYTSTEKTGLVYSPILPIMLAFLAPHLAGYISSALPGAAVTGTAALEAGALGAVPATAANTLASNVLTGGIMGGTTAVARDQDFWKGFGSGALNPLVSYGVGSLMPSFLPSNINPAVARAITGTTSNLITNAITGQGNAGDILKSGILSGATDYALGNVFNSLNLSPETIKLLTGIAIPTAVSGKFNPISAISTLASTGQAGATR